MHLWDFHWQQYFFGLVYVSNRGTKLWRRARASVFEGLFPGQERLLQSEAKGGRMLRWMLKKATKAAGTGEGLESEGQRTESKRARATAQN